MIDVHAINTITDVSATMPMQHPCVACAEHFIISEVTDRFHQHAKMGVSGACERMQIMYVHKKYSQGGIWLHHTRKLH